MCFSAGASFGAGVILTTIGVASIKKSESNSQIFFASIPLIFAVQQISEGFLWLALTNSNFAFLKWPATYLFLLIAQVIWPFWVPFSLLKLIKNKKRRKVEKILLLIGILVSLFLAFCLINYRVEAKIMGMHIFYDQDYPKFLSNYGGIFYVIATIIPPFLSKYKRMCAFGTAILISYIITHIYYPENTVSVWCFFASVISISVYSVLFEMKKSKENIMYMGFKKRNYLNK